MIMRGFECDYFMGRSACKYSCEYRFDWYRRSQYSGRYPLWTVWLCFSENRHSSLCIVELVAQ